MSARLVFIYLENYINKDANISYHNKPASPSMNMNRFI